MATVSVPAGTRHMRLGRPLYPAWRQGLTPNIWHNIAGAVGERLVDLNPWNLDQFNPGGAGAPIEGEPISKHANLILAWNSGIYDPVRKWLYVWGGGDADYWGNELYSLDLKADVPRWAMRTIPAGTIQKPGILKDGLDATGLYLQDPREPRAPHSYNNFEIDQHGELITGPLTFVFPAQSTSPKSFQYQRTENRWEEIQNLNPTGGGNNGCLLADRRPGNESFYYLPNDLRQLRRRTLLGPWANIGASTVHNTGGCIGFIHEPTQRLLLFSNFTPGHVYAWDVSGGVPSGNSQVVATTGTAPTASSQYGACHDTTRDRYLIWEDGANFFAFDPNTDTWSAVTADAGNTIVPDSSASGGKTYRRFFYDPDYDCVGLITETQNPVHIFPFT